MLDTASRPLFIYLGQINNIQLISITTNEINLINVIV